MISVTIGTNTDQHDITVNPNSVIQDVLNDERIDWSAGALYLNGSQLKPDDIYKTFTDLHIVTDCMLICVVKANGGK